MVRTAPLTTNSSDVLTVQTDTDDAIVPHGDDMEQSEVSANNVPMRGDTAPSNSDRVILVTTPLTGVWGAQTPIPKPCRV